MIIGLAISGIFDVIHNHKQKVFGYLCFVLAGFLLVIISISAAFFFKGVFVEFADALVFYNIKYSASGIFSVSDFLRNSEFRMYWYIFLIAYALVTVVFLIKVFFKPEEFYNYFLDSLVIFACAIEVYLVSISGRIYPHYLIILFPYLGWMIGSIINTVFPAVNEHKYTFVMPTIYLMSFVTVFYFSILDFDFMQVGDYMLRDRKSGVDAGNVIVRYVNENSSQDDLVLVWGNVMYGLIFFPAQVPHKIYISVPVIFTWLFRCKHGKFFSIGFGRDPPKLVVAILSVDFGEIIPFDDFMNLCCTRLANRLAA